MMTCPVMQSDSGPTRKPASPAISWGGEGRPNKILDEKLSMNSPFFLMTPLSSMSCSSPSHNSVTTTPGAKALTVILCLANSRAAACIREITEALLRAIGREFGVALAACD